MSDPEPIPDDYTPVDMAAEYVLGVLDDEDRARLTARLDRDPAYRAHDEAWERRLAPLLDEVAPGKPSDRLWMRLESVLTPTATVLPFRRRPPLGSRVEIWRAASAGLAAAVVGLVMILVSRPNPEIRRPRAAPLATSGAVLTASLTTRGGKVLWVAVVEPSRRDVTVIPVAGLTHRGRSPELWIIPAGGKPKSVGVLADARGTVPSPVLDGAKADETLAVTLEPMGGSPSGAPTGPVVASGALTAAL